MKKFRLLCAAAAIAVPAATLVAPAAYAQQITASVSGQVTDEAGGPLQGATVTVTDTRTGATRTITTGSDGLFGAQGLVTGGPYTIAVEAPNYQGQTVEAVNLTVQGTTSFTFALAGADQGEAIVVTAQRANVQLRAIGPGTAFSQAVLETAPTFNRDVRDIIRIDPRVSLDRDDGGSGSDRISCLGGNDRGNAFTVDGILQSDLYGLNDTGFSSRSSTPIPYDAIRETQVQFAPYDVEYGQFTGCAINVVTRSGGNQFHGDAFFEYSDNGLRGGSVDGQPVGPIDADKRWGVALGGPIFRDRLFFFAAYEHQEAGESQDEGPTGAGFPNEVRGVSIDQFNEISSILSSTYGIETGAPPTNLPFENDRWFGRLDWQVTDDHRLELTYQRLEESTVRSDDLFTGSSPQIVGLNTFYLSGTQSNYYSARLYSQWTDNFSTEIRYSRSDIQDLQDPIGGGEAQSANPIPRILVGIDNPDGTPDATVLAGPGNSRSANDLQTKVDLYRIVANLDAGDHRFKLGFEVNRTDIFNLFVQNATGTLVFRNVDDLREGILSDGTSTSTFPSSVISGGTVGAFGNFSRTGDVNDAAADFNRSIYSVYLQDEWRLNDQLEVVLGVRTDLFSGSRPDVNPNFAARYGFPNTTGFSDLDPVFLPRVAFTYDLDDFAVFSRTQLRGGVGIFSGGDPLVWFGNAFQNNGFGFAEGNTTAAACGDGPIDVVSGGAFTGVPTCIQSSGITRAAGGLGDTQSIDPDITVPTVVRANFGVQSQMNFAPSGFFSGWRLNLDYIYSRYRNPYTLVDLSQAPIGVTVDGRPIYRALDPTAAGCDAELVDLTPAPVYQNLSAACFVTGRDDELMLTNSAGFSSHVASVILSKNFDGGLFTSGGSSFFTLGYAYTDSRDRRNMYNSTAGSNYDLSAAFDRQNPDVSRGFYNSRHNFTVSGNFSETFFADLETQLGFTFVARSGRPYSLTFAGGGVFNDTSSGNNNALLYIPSGMSDPNVSPDSDPAAVEALAAFANSLGCASGYVGRSIARNTCSNDWYFDLDLNFSQDLPGPGRLISGGRFEDRIRVYAMFDNFLNFLDSGWNVQRRRNFAGLQEVASLGGGGLPPIDDQGRYVITDFIGQDAFDDDNLINVSSSVWRIKVGISYNF
ncbi:TonB-dependent receptor [Sphingosinicella terrae]|uniref:TonB-dependent receptor n=1 Tax=Sphingosinicella terrae TaxID=2172047 RepID=UPI000E0D0147|nr:carboxypeptidase regulatory-like domain-containing protein [Sphingosinicella terrae]